MRNEQDLFIELNGIGIESASFKSLGAWAIDECSELGLSDIDDYQMAIIELMGSFDYKIVHKCTCNMSRVDAVTVVYDEIGDEVYYSRINLAR